jgi:hypothetical protein
MIDPLIDLAVKPESVAQQTVYDAVNAFRHTTDRQSWLQLTLDLQPLMEQAKQAYQDFAERTDDNWKTYVRPAEDTTDAVTNEQPTRPSSPKGHSLVPFGLATECTLALMTLAPTSVRAHAAKAGLTPTSTMLDDANNMIWTHLPSFTVSDDGPGAMEATMNLCHRISGREPSATGQWKEPHQTSHGSGMALIAGTRQNLTALPGVDSTSVFDHNTKPEGITDGWWFLALITIATWAHNGATIKDTVPDTAPGMTDQPEGVPFSTSEWARPLIRVIDFATYYANNVVYRRERELRRYTFHCKTEGDLTAFALRKYLVKPDTLWLCELDIPPVTVPERDIADQACRDAQVASPAVLTTSVGNTELADLVLRASALKRLLCRHAIDTTWLPCSGARQTVQHMIGWTEHAIDRLRRPPPLQATGTAPANVITVGHHTVAPNQRQRQVAGVEERPASFKDTIAHDMVGLPVYATVASYCPPGQEVHMMFNLFVAIGFGRKDQSEGRCASIQLRHERQYSYAVEQEGTREAQFRIVTTPPPALKMAVDAQNLGLWERVKHQGFISTGTRSDTLSFYQGMRVCFTLEGNYRQRTTGGWVRPVGDEEWDTLFNNAMAPRQNLTESSAISRASFLRDQRPHWNYQRLFGPTLEGVTIGDANLVLAYSPVETPGSTAPAGLMTGDQSSVSSGNESPPTPGSQHRHRHL